MSSAQMQGLTLSKVSKTYSIAGGRELTAVKDVSLQLAPNRIGVLIGPSGCGKSTLLRMVAGLERRTDGEICLNGAAARLVQRGDRRAGKGSWHGVSELYLVPLADGT